MAPNRNTRSESARWTWTPHISTVIIVVFAVIAAVLPWVVLAATQTLNGLSGSGCPNGTGWTTVACWNNQAGPVPVTGDDVVIGPGQNPALTNYDLGADVQLRSITLISTNNIDTSITGGPIVLQSGGFITDNFGSDVTTFNHTFPGVTLNGPATFARGNVGSTLVFSGAITGTGGLTLVNNGIVDGLRLTVASTYTGSTTVNGTARVRSDVNGAIPTGSALTVNGSALFQTDSTIGSLAGGGIVFMNGDNTLTAGGDDTSTTFSGVYQDSGGAAALTKVGTGTLTLSGANTYTGATAVNQGTLNIDGMIASPVTVNLWGTLGGTGTINNTVTVNSLGMLSPGTSTGILNTGDLTLNGGSMFTIELNGLTVGTEYDQVNVNGMVTLDQANLDVVLGFSPNVGDLFTIINNADPDPVVGAFMLLPEGATFCVGSTLFTISYMGGDGNDVTLMVTFDDVPPQIACPPNQTVQAGAGCQAIINPGTATATDNCTPNPTIVGTRSDGQPLNAPYPLGITTITWMATDYAGNTAVCDQTITVLFGAGCFDVCIRDDKTGNIFRFSSTLGRWELLLCRKGTKITGDAGPRGVRELFCKIFLSQSASKSSRAIAKATANTCTGVGSAIVVANGVTYLINDSNMADSSCSCP